MGLWAAVALAGQTPSAGTLSAALQAHVQSERFQIVTSIRGLPLGVRGELAALFGHPGLDIAEPGARFRATTATDDPTLPIRRLAVAGCSMDHCLVYYERGGDALTWRAALFHWMPAATRFEWGGAAPAGLTTVEAVRDAVLSGAIKSSDTLW